MLKKLLFLIPLSLFSVFLVDGKSIAEDRANINVMNNVRNVPDEQPLMEIEVDPFDQFWDDEGKGGLPANEGGFPVTTRPARAAM